MIIRKIRLTEYEYQPPINFVAGATEPDIQFQLADYTIPAGATARCYVQRFDGTFEYTVATIDGNNVTVEPTSSMFSVRGEGAIQITLYAGEEVLKNFSVPVFVHADLADENAEQGSDVTGIFRAAEEQALEDFAEDAEAKAAEVIESIPADYTELTEEVSELNERLGEIPGVPSNVRQAINSILNAAVYTSDELRDEFVILEEWASTDISAIILSQDTITFDGTGSVRLRATKIPSDATGSIYWASNDQTVAVVTQDGTVTAVGNGTCVISAVVGDIIATCSVTVQNMIIYRSIVNNLVRCTSNNDASIIADGSSYHAELTAQYTNVWWRDVSVKMNDIDITESVYDETTHEITIPSVTGNVIITATTDIYSFETDENLIKMSAATSAAATHPGKIILTTASANRRRSFVFGLYGEKHLSIGMDTTDSDDTFVDSDYYPIPVPKDATGAIVTITPSSQFIGFGTWTLQDGAYARVDDSGWIAGTHTVTFEAGTRQYATITSKYDSSGSSYPTEPSSVTLVFTK